MEGGPTLIKRLQSGFENAVVVVIGGTGGIGNAVCRHCAELGAIVVSGSRSVIPSLHPDTSWRSITLDITEPASIRRFFDCIQDEFGRIDILVNTAGHSIQLPNRELQALTDPIITDMLQVNLGATLTLCREAESLLRRGREPVIINVSSIAANTGGGSNMAYAAAKAGVDTLAKSLARALAPDIRVVNVSPSALDTPFARGRSEVFLETTANASALKRIASLDEVATAILCAARLLTATTGAVIPVDAGRSL